MISLPDTSTLTPTVVEPGLYTCPASGTSLVRLDLLTEAGSAYQERKLCASAAAKLATVATNKLGSAALSEFMDYRGILVETDSQTLQVSQTFYFLRRYADELLPVVGDMMRGTAFTDSDFEVWSGKRRQDILAAEQKTSAIARRLFYEKLFGLQHPLGSYATAADLDRLTAADVRRHHDTLYTPDRTTVVLGGMVDEKLLDLVGRHLPHGRSVERPALPAFTAVAPQRAHQAMATATQTTVRVGRVLPLRWDDMDYARLTLVVTALGGYFGSRLMSNLREDKGYTYGIYSRTQIYRGVIVFYITADVAAASAEAAVGEIMNELGRLCSEPIGEEELEMVRNVMAGDFLRSVDGVFERSARFCDQYGACVDERLTDNLRLALATATPAELQSLSARLLQPSLMTVCTAGA